MDREAINAVFLEDKIAEIIEDLCRFRFPELQSILILRDGHVCGDEGKAIDGGLNRWMRAGILSQSASIDIVDYQSAPSRICACGPRIAPLQTSLKGEPFIWVTTPPFFVAQGPLHCRPRQLPNLADYRHERAATFGALQLAFSPSRSITTSAPGLLTVMLSPLETSTAS